MYVAYFDEAKPDGSIQPDYWYCGLMLNADAIKTVDESVIDLSLNIFSKEIAARDTEFHAKDIVHGKKAFKNINIAERLDIYNKLLRIVKENNLKYVYSRIKIDNLPSGLNYSPRDIAFMFFVERVNYFCKGKKSYGIMIGDSDREYDNTAIKSLCQYKIVHTDWKYGTAVNNLLDTVYFGCSHDSRLLQLVDVFCYALVNNSKSGKMAYFQSKVRDIYRELDFFPANYKVWPNKNKA